MNRLLHQYTRNITTIIIAVLFATSLWQLATASWIQGKAIVAQQLLNHSWHTTLENSSDDKNLSKHRPWPWADTWPAAKLIVPAHDIEQIILAGDSGSSLAFAPGYSLAGATLNTHGTMMISGHRDTHFSFLQDIELNDKLSIQTADKTLSYQVYDIRIVDSTRFSLLDEPDETKLVLVTCYPFDAINARGSLRYLVYANLV